jgi:hypothetical protein
MSGDKIPPSVELQSEAAARIEKVAQEDLIGLASDAQSVIAHVRALEASFIAVIAKVGTSEELTYAMTAMSAARQWVVTHFTT